ncbi:MAG: glycosyltransferase family 4 protein [Patescibacteria group bacterium]
MKLLFISEYFPRGKELRFSGGVEARTFYIAKYLAKKHEVHVVTSKLSDTKSNEKLFGINVHRVGPIRVYKPGAETSSIIAIINFTREAIKVGQNLKPDIVDGGNFISHTIAKEIGNKLKIPTVFWYPDVFLGNWVKTSGYIAGLGGWLNEKFNLLRGADMFIAISKVTRDKLIKNGVSSSKIRVIPCGVDKKEFVGTSHKYNETTIVCVSRLVGYKRIEDLIWAFALLLKENKGIQLVIIGRGPTENKINNIIKMLNIKKHVTIKLNLPRKELIETLKSSHLFCLPSEIEGFGISVVEAMAAKIPYVISNIPVFKEITHNGKGGSVFKLGDQQDLKSKLSKLLSNKSFYNSKIKESEGLLSIYNWEKIASQTESVYKSLL